MLRGAGYSLTWKYRGLSFWVFVFWFYGFIVLRLYGVMVYDFMLLWIHCFLVSTICQLSISCFQEDIDPISKIFRNSLEGSSKVVDACLFDFQSFRFTF